MVFIIILKYYLLEKMFFFHEKIKNLDEVRYIDTSYEAGMNPVGLFVSTSFDTVKEFSNPFNGEKEKMRPS